MGESSQSSDEETKLSAVVTPDPDATRFESHKTTSTTPEVGAVLKGKYRLDSKIGEGGMGVVFKALDLDVGDPNYFVAVKLIRPELNTPFTRASLIKEVMVTKKFQNDHIINVAGFEQDRDLAFMVMEFLTGRPLDRIIDEENALGMPFRSASHIIDAMAEGLTYAHRQGVIHSDFKPSNVFVTAAGAKVLDFGIARAAGAPLIGITANYASCEMLDDPPANPDPRDDVYAFGLVVYKLLSGRHPFSDELGREISATMARRRGMTVAPIKGLTRRQHQALVGALHFDRQGRTRSIDEVTEGLKRPDSPILLWVALGVLSLGLLIFGGYQVYEIFGPKDSDAAFIASLVNSGASRSTSTDVATQKDLLELGNDLLKEGGDPVDVGLLSENTQPLSSALLAFEEVRKADPGNLAAAKGILSIVKLYKSEARRMLDAGRLQEAASIAHIAQRLWPDSEDLKRLNAKIDAQIRASHPHA